MPTVRIIKGADFRVELTGPKSARIAIADSPAFEEDDACSWFAGLSATPHRALDAIAGSVDARARCHPVEDTRGARLAWDVVIDHAAEPQLPPRELALAKISRGAGFRFQQRRRLRN